MCPVLLAGDGILVLSKYQGHAELSFKRLDREGSLLRIIMKH